MKRVISLNIFILLVIKLNSQTNYDFVKDYSAVYIPDENTTYFTEQIKLKKIEGGEEIVMQNIIAKLNGNYSNLIMALNPNLKPIVKFNMKRKVIRSSIGSISSIVCVYGGTLCVILFPKGIIEEE